MLRSKNNKRFLLAALLISAATTLLAQAPQPGIFSISPTECVYFAKGNIQRDNSTGNYLLASSQTEILGASNEFGSTGKRDLFEWTELADIKSKTSYRLLTVAEWQYLFGYDSHSGFSRGNAYSLFAMATVNGVHGLVILPDCGLWQQPAGVPEFNYYDTGEGFDKNVYSAAQWALMEAAGAVFLPAAGTSDGTTVYYANELAKYWMNSQYNSDRAYVVQFDQSGGEGHFYDFEHWPKESYFAVRPIASTAPTTYLTEYDEQSTFVPKKAHLRTKSGVYVQRTLRKAGCFNTLTLPFDVKDIDNSPLGGDGVEVYEFVDASVIGKTLTLDITKVTSNSLEAGVPYLIQWDNTGEVLNLMHFEDVEESDWDSNDIAKDVSIPKGHVTFHGFYSKTHINDASISGVSHSNLFLGANNSLYWPSDGADPNAKMLGFRAYFEVTVAGGGAGMPRRAPQSNGIYKGMPAQFRIVNRENTATGLEDTDTASPIPTKIMRDGQLIIIRNNVEYSISGQIISQ